MKTDTRKVITSLTLTSGLRAELDAVAAEEESSRSRIAGIAIREYIARRRAAEAQQADHGRPARD